MCVIKTASLVELMKIVKRLIKHKTNFEITITYKEDNEDGATS